MYYKFFRTGDRVYHRRLKQYGTFIKYNYNDEQCFVNFEDEYGDIECKHVSVSQLQGVCKYVMDNNICSIGASNSGKCQFIDCSFYVQSRDEEN